MSRMSMIVRPTPRPTRPQGWRTIVLLVALVALALLTLSPSDRVVALVLAAVVIAVLRGVDWRRARVERLEVTPQQVIARSLLRTRRVRTQDLGPVKLFGIKERAFEGWWQVWTTADGHVLLFARDREWPFDELREAIGLAGVPIENVGLLKNFEDAQASGVSVPWPYANMPLIGLALAPFLIAAAMLVFEVAG